eukprot:jgi/Ulvmu1/10435/UM062_0032.1
MSDGVEVTVVLDAEGLRGAVEYGAKHIELRAHVDLTTLPPLLDGRGVSRDKLLGYLSEEVQSIRGRCDTPPLQSLSAPLSDVADLAPLKPAQCLIVTDIDLMTVQHRSVWLDNVYLRLRRSQRSATPLMVTVDPPGELYMTNVTMQGDSVGPCQALVVRSPALLQDSRLLNMGGGLSVVLVEGGTASMRNVLMSSMFVPDPAGLVQAELPGSAARLENTTVTAVTAAQQFRVSDGGVIYADANASVFDDTAMADTASLPLEAVPDERVFLATSDEWLLQLQQDLEAARVVPYTAPSSSGISGTVLIAIIASVAVVFVLACILAWRHTRHRIFFDGWGLPVRQLKSDRSPEVSNSHTISQLPSRPSQQLGQRGSMGLESAHSMHSGPSMSASSAAPPSVANSRTPPAAPDTEPESCTGTIDKSPLDHLPNTSGASHGEIRSASTLSDAKHSPSTPWQGPRRDPAAVPRAANGAAVPRAANGAAVRPLRPLHSSTHIQFASSILETFPHGFPEEHPSPSREMRGTNGIHQLALASAPQLTRELMDALPPEPRSGTSPISTNRTVYRREDSDTITAAAADMSPRLGESAMAVLQHMPSSRSRTRSTTAAAVEPGSSAGVGSNATLPPRGGESVPLVDTQNPYTERVASNTQSMHLSSFGGMGGSGSEIESAEPSGPQAASSGCGHAGAPVYMPPIHMQRGPPRHALPPAAPVGGSVHVRGQGSSGRWLQPRHLDPIANGGGGAWHMQSSQGSDHTSGDITGTPDTDMTQTQLPLPPGNMGGHSANIGALPFVPTPRRYALGGQGAQLAVAPDTARGSGSGDGVAAAAARSPEVPPGAAMHALNKYRARVAAQVQGHGAVYAHAHAHAHVHAHAAGGGGSSGTDTASGRVGGTATMGELSAGQSSWLDGTGELTPPPPHASSDEKLDHIDAQLDSLSRETVLNLYELFGGGERRRGGQAIIQFAKRLHSREEFALKFFLNRTDYEAEAACYRSAHLGSFMPAVERYVDNDDGAMRDAAGNPMPPCIIMERGESLRDRMQLAHTDKAGTAQVLVNVARRLADLHEAGWVHRDLKPGNVLWLPRKQRWTLIDFALAATVGSEASVVFTPSYAAPEIIRAAVEKRHSVKASAAMDAWALGVMAFELLTGHSVFDHQEPDMKRVYAQLLGEEPLPWEGERLTAALRKSLGIFRTNVLRLLDRSPAKRMTMQQFANACDAIFDSRTMANHGRSILSITQ